MCLNQYVCEIDNQQKDDLKTINRRLIRNLEVKNQQLLKEIYDHKNGRNTWKTRTIIN